MMRISPAIPVAPSILHSRQTRILLAIQEMKRQGRKAVSLKCSRRTCEADQEDDCSSTISGRHSMSDVIFRINK
jgi:hypothetical protein